MKPVFVFICSLVLSSALVVPVPATGAWTRIDRSDLRGPDSIYRGAVGHVNLIWSYSGSMSAGIEYM